MKRETLFYIFIALLILNVVDLIIHVLRAQELPRNIEEPLTFEDEPLSYGYIIRDASGEIVYTVGRNWFDDDLAVATCLDGGSIDACSEEIEELDHVD